MISVVIMSSKIEVVFAEVFANYATFMIGLLTGKKDMTPKFTYLLIDLRKIVPKLTKYRKRQCNKNLVKNNA